MHFSSNASAAGVSALLCAFFWLAGYGADCNTEVSSVAMVMAV